MPKIKAPKPAAQSFNKRRSISDLLRWQVRHMHAVEMALPFDQRTGINVHEIKTEEQAGAYLQKATQKLVEKVHLSTKVPVPKPAKGAHNKNRRLSQLLKNQVQHFHELEKAWPREKQTGADIETLKTEGDAAAYISAVTGNLLAQG